MVVKEDQYINVSVYNYMAEITFTICNVWLYTNSVRAIGFELALYRVGWNTQYVTTGMYIKFEFNNCNTKSCPKQSGKTYRPMDAKNSLENQVVIVETMNMHVTQNFGLKAQMVFDNISSKVNIWTEI